MSHIGGSLPDSPPFTQPMPMQEQSYAVYVRVHREQMVATISRLRDFRPKVHVVETGRAPQRIIGRYESETSKP